MTDAIENIPAGYRARDTYRRVGPDEFEETFEIAEPGKDFALYSRSILRRVKWRQTGLTGAVRIESSAAHSRCSRANARPEPDLM